MSNYSTVVNKTTEALRMMGEVHKLLSGGPETFYFEKMKEYAEALFDRFAPFRVGDAVSLTRDIDVDKGSGWFYWRHLLKAGRTGKVLEVDFHKGKFIALIAIDNCTWIDDAGEHRPTDRSKNFFLRETEIARIEVTP